MLKITVKEIQRKIEGLPPLSETDDKAKFEVIEEHRTSRM